MEAMRLVAQCPRHVEDLLAEEVARLGAADVQPRNAACLFSGSLEIAYRLWHWSRIASRLLLPVADAETTDRDQLYQLARELPWHKHLGVDDTFAVAATVSGHGWTDSRFATLVVKDAIADSFRARSGRRPSVDRRDPVVRVHVLLRGTAATISVDCGGSPLHRRGYRPAAARTVEAPLKENVAAAMLLRAKWPAVAADGGMLMDPMCGSGTLLIEGAAMAADLAPGLLRGAARSRALRRWQEREPALWRSVHEEAVERRRAGLERLVAVRGADADRTTVAAARAAVERAGLGGYITIARGELSQLEAPPDAERGGLVVANPPYGVRLGGAGAVAGGGASGRARAGPGAAASAPPLPTRRGDARARGNSPRQMEHGPLRRPGQRLPTSGTWGSGETPPPALTVLYATLGRVLAERFQGWQAAVLTASEELGRATALRAHRLHRLDNGRIECRLLHVQLDAPAPAAARAATTDNALAAAAVDDTASEPAAPAAAAPPTTASTVTASASTSRAPAAPGKAEAPAKATAPPTATATATASASSTATASAKATSHATRPAAGDDTAPPATTRDPSTAEQAQLLNRLRKNARHFGRWARRHDISCYRVYDADLPTYNAAVDLFESRWVQVQEYTAPPEIAPGRAAAHLRQLITAVQEVLDVDPADVFVKRRSRQRGTSQYQQLASQGTFFAAHEAGLELLLNFTDYLDVGLFPDHRWVRRLIRSLAAGRSFLNLFAYTGAATVAAAAGGASTTVSVDSSHTYLDWAHENLARNGFTDRRHHQLQRADCFAWLAQEQHGEFDLILVDPPTFSNSKGRRANFDVQRDHLPLLEQACRRLAPGGTLLFASNRRGFKLDQPGVAALGLTANNLSHELLPLDYARRRHSFHAWQLTR